MPRSSFRSRKGEEEEEEEEEKEEEEEEEMEGCLDRFVHGERRSWSGLVTPAQVCQWNVRGWGPEVGEF